MANENIEIPNSNFCMGPQAGTICTIDTTNPKTVLKIKDTGGSTIIDLTLSSNIVNTNPRLEYVGPTNLPGLIDELTFFTFEKVSSSTCMIKRWQTRLAYNELLLKEQIVKYSSGDDRFNGIDFAVEHHFRKFTAPNEYYNYLNMDSVANVKTGTKFFLGPSTDTTNEGATEIATVSHVIDYIGGKRVYLTAPLKYEYAIDDSIIFYSNVYIYSYDGYGGDSDKGTLYKLDAYNWRVVSIDTKTIYKRVTASRWCSSVGAVASIMGTNMLFVKPYDSYLIWKSMFLGNVEDDNNTVFPVYDVIFDNYSIYKLQKKTTLKDDEGNKQTWNWSKFNYQEDSLLPYTSSIVTWLDQSIVTGYYKEVDIYTIVRDQFHVGLRDIYVDFYKTGDQDALFDPLSGTVISDINGAASIIYRSGSNYDGHTEVTTRSTGSSSSTGSSYTWTSNNIISYANTTPLYEKIFQLKEVSEDIGGMVQVENDFISDVSMFGYSFFTSPGGPWGSTLYNGGAYVGITEVKNHLPLLYLGDEIQIDSPKGGPGYGFHVWPFPTSSNEGPFFIGDRITQVEDVSSENLVKSVSNFLIYDKANPGDENGYVPYLIIVQPEEIGNGQISQLKLSLHTHWVDGSPYDTLWTYVNVDQFVFVEDAIPKFWSEKNPVGTNIWIRLRPFAFSLDNSTLRMWVREYSYLGDTGYYEVTDRITLENFDAGSDLLGIEVTYDPQISFLHNSLVFVRIEVYDESLTPNFIYTEYWFKVTPDYKVPYLLNLDPDRADINVPVDSTISFEIKDEGTGLDMSTLECLLNSRVMGQEDLYIEEFSRYHIKVTYTPPQMLYFDKEYKVTVKITDTAYEENRMNDSYSFTTASSSGVIITNPIPGVCKRGMGRFEDVKVLVLAGGDGVDEESIRMQVFNRDVFPNVLPVIYRIS